MVMIRPTHEIDVKRINRGELLSWLRLNGLDPNVIPEDARLWVEEGPDGEWHIRCRVFLRNASGFKYADPKTHAPVEQERIQPLLFDPPLHWLKTMSA